MKFNATFKNISFISWRWRKPEYPEKPPTCCNSTDNLYHIMLYWVHLAWVGFELTTLVVIGTDCTDSCKSNYHTITTTTAPKVTWHVPNMRHALATARNTSLIRFIPRTFLYYCTVEVGIESFLSVLWRYSVTSISNWGAIVAVVVWYM